MTAFDIFIVAIKIIVLVVPLGAALILFVYYDRPTDLSTATGVKYFIVYSSSFILILIIWFILLLLLFQVWQLSLLLLLIPILLLFMAFIILQILLAQIGKSLRKSQSAVIESLSDNSDKGIAKGRKQYSKYYLEQYRIESQSHPERKHILKQLALLAVKKDKKNPEARYLLAQSYLRLHKLKKAEKQARAAVELEPDNETYRQLWDEIPKSGRTDIRV